MAAKNRNAISSNDDDFNDDLPVGRILTRREVIQLAGAAGISLTVGSSTIIRADTGDPITLVASPEVTEGPFFVDEKLNRSNLLEGTTRAGVIQGLPLALGLRVFTVSGGKGIPLPGANVDIWHCDTLGVYSDEASGGIQSENTKGQKWLRGFQITDKSGTATFRTIYPGWYPGRAVHIHFKVRRYSETGQKTYEFTSQLFFDDRLSDTVFARKPYRDRGKRFVLNTNDGIYRQRTADGTEAGAHLLLRPTLNSGGTGYTANFNIGIDLSRPQSAGRGGRPGGPAERRGRMPW